MRLEVCADGAPDRGKKGRFAELTEESEALQLVLDRILQLGEAQLDVGLPQSFVELGKDVRSSDVDARYGLGRHNQPAYWSWGPFRGLDDALMKQLGIGEEQRRVPTEEDETGNEARVWIATDVVIAFDACRLVPKRLSGGAKHPTETR